MIDLVMLVSGGEDLTQGTRNKFGRLPEPKIWATVDGVAKRAITKQPAQMVLSAFNARLQDIWRLSAHNS